MRVSPILCASLVVVLFLAVSTGAQTTTPQRRLLITADTCRSLFNAAGGVGALTRLLPSVCVPGAAFNSNACCVQAKAGLKAIPQVPQCLCNADVWAEVKSQAGSAGFGKTLSDFVASCGISVAGSSGC